MLHPNGNYKGGFTKTAASRVLKRITNAIVSVIPKPPCLTAGPKCQKPIPFGVLRYADILPTKLTTRAGTVQHHLVYW